MALELPLEELLRRLAQQDGAGASLGPWKSDDSLIEIDLLARRHRISLRRISVSHASFAISRKGEGIVSRTRISSSGRSHRTRVSSSGKKGPGVQRYSGLTFLSIARNLRRSSLERDDACHNKTFDLALKDDELQLT